MRSIPKGLEGCKCKAVYSEHQFDDRATAYRLFCRKCRKHIGWISWIPVEGKTLGMRAGDFVKSNFEKF